MSNVNRLLAGLVAAALACGHAAAQDAKKPDGGAPPEGAKPAEPPKKGKKAKGDLEARLKEADADKDGKLTVDEFRKLLEKMGDAKPAKKMLEKLDKAFGAADADGDGKLSLDELKKVFDKKKKKDADKA